MYLHTVSQSTCVLGVPSHHIPQHLFVRCTYTPYLTAFVCLGCSPHRTSCFLLLAACSASPHLAVTSVSYHCVMREQEEWINPNFLTFGGRCVYIGAAPAKTLSVSTLRTAVLWKSLPFFLEFLNGYRKICCLFLSEKEYMLHLDLLNNMGKHKRLINTCAGQSKKYQAPQKLVRCSLTLDVYRITSDAFLFRLIAWPKVFGDTTWY